MPDYLVTCTIPYFSGIPEDVVVNTWSFDLVDDTEANFLQAVSFIGTFYDGIRLWLSPVLDTENPVLKIYDRADPEPRVPVYTATGDFGATGTAIQLPEEVALCLSFRGVLEAGQPQARRRGRVYLGPFNVDALSDIGDLGGRQRPNPDLQTAILDSYEAAWAALTTAGNVHTVWSSADATAYPVVQAWCDNAWDTQRRRGGDPTSRITRNGPF